MVAPRSTVPGPVLLIEPPLPGALLPEKVALRMEDTPSPGGLPGLSALSIAPPSAEAVLPEKVESATESVPVPPSYPLSPFSIAPPYCAWLPENVEPVTLNVPMPLSTAPPVCSDVFAEKAESVTVAELDSSGNRPRRLDRWRWHPHPSRPSRR